MCIDMTNSFLNRVCILWQEGEYLCSLRYGDGTIRTYPPDRLDGRAGKTVAVTDEQELWAAFHDGAHCRVPVNLAIQVFCWDESEFATE